MDPIPEKQEMNITNIETGVLSSTTEIKNEDCNNICDDSRQSASEEAKLKPVPDPHPLFFSGKEGEDCLKFLEKLNKHFDTFNLNDEQRLVAFSLHLMGKALDISRKVPAKYKNNWNEFQKWFAHQFAITLHNEEQVLYAPIIPENATETMRWHTQALMHITERLRRLDKIEFKIVKTLDKLDRMSYEISYMHGLLIQQSRAFGVVLHMLSDHGKPREKYELKCWSCGGFNHKKADCPKFKSFANNTYNRQRVRQNGISHKP